MSKRKHLSDDELEQKIIKKTTEKKYSLDSDEEEGEDDNILSDNDIEG